MKADAALVQSVFDFAIREINALEVRIVQADDDADTMLWEQARQVVEQLNAGLSQRALARQWINTRTGHPYDEHHVRYVRQVFAQGAELTPHPRFRDAYNAIANAAGPSKFDHLTGNYEWYTPAPIVEAARAVMGGIDLDPASSDYAQTVVQASEYYTEQDNGLERDWHGRVFLNPPFKHPLVRQFAEKLLASPAVTQAVWLSNACIEVAWWQALALNGLVCFHRGRIKFYDSVGTLCGSPPDGQTIIYLGPNRDAFCRRFAEIGLVLVRP